ncbi:hypothetical protein ACYZT7_15690 [Pseudomonas sp. RT4P38]
MISENFQAPSAADLHAVPGFLATALNALLFKELKDFLSRGERVLERVNTPSCVRLEQVFIQKYLKTLLDNRSRSQYCSRRQEELSSLQSKSSASREVPASDVI